MVKRTMIISAFPGCGAQWLTERQDKLTFCAKGVDTKFSFVNLGSQLITEGGNVRSRLQQVLELSVGRVDFIFVPQYGEVLTFLNDVGVPFVMVFPNNLDGDASVTSEIKKQWAARLARKTDAKSAEYDVFVLNRMNSYEVWVSNATIERYKPALALRLNRDQFLSDFISDLYLKKESLDKYVCNGSTSCMDLF